MDSEIRLVWQASCVGGDCEAFYDAPGGGVVIQGKVLDDAMRAQLVGLGADEDAVFVTPSLIEHLRRH